MHTYKCNHTLQYVQFGTTNRSTLHVFGLAPPLQCLIPLVHVETLNTSHMEVLLTTHPHYTVTTLATCHLPPVLGPGVDFLVILGSL